jgi:hypothetical protein
MTDVWDPRRPLAEQSVPLPTWRPGLPADRRRAIEAEAIAREDLYPWRLYLGRCAAPPAADPDRALGRLCAVADLLCLDLVVEARREPWGTLTWDVRYEVPGAGVPEQPGHRAHDLPEAVATTRVRDALAGLAERGLRAPVHDRPGLARPPAATRGRPRPGRTPGLRRRDRRPPGARRRPGRHRRCPGDLARGPVVAHPAAPRSHHRGARRAVHRADHHPAGDRAAAQLGTAGSGPAGRADPLHDLPGL